MQLVAIYRSQKCPVDQFLDIIDSTLSIHAQDSIIIVGDSNIDLFSNPCYTDSLALFQNYDCDTANSFVTRPASKSCIDLIFSNFVDRIYVDSIECKLSDHNILCCKIKDKRKNGNDFEVIETDCDYDKARGHLGNSLPVDYDSSAVSELLDKLVMV